MTYIYELAISIRAYNCLNNARIYTVEQLLAMDRKSLLAIENLGKRSVLNIENALEAYLLEQLEKLRSRRN